MITEETLMKFGFIKDESSLLKLKEIFKDNVKLKEVHIDTYTENPLIASSAPFMLLLRTIEKKTMVSNDENRLILRKVVDKFETYFMNILFSEITECYYKDTDVYFEFIINIQNIYYRITIFN